MVHDDKDLLCGECGNFYDPAFTYNNHGATHLCIPPYSTPTNIYEQILIPVLEVCDKLINNRSWPDLPLATDTYISSLILFQPGTPHYGNVFRFLLSGKLPQVVVSALIPAFTRHMGIQPSLIKVLDMSNTISAFVSYMEHSCLCEPLTYPLAEDGYRDLLDSDKAGRFKVFIDDHEKHFSISYNPDHETQGNCCASHHSCPHGMVLADLVPAVELILEYKAGLAVPTVV